MVLRWSAACGGSVGLTPDAGTPPPGNDGGDAGCGFGEVCCGMNNNGCLITVGLAACSDAAWVCPSGQTAAVSCGALCDAGVDGGDATTHPGDAMVNADVGHGGDASDGAAPFTCGDQGLTCHAASEYCYVVEGGTPPPDGGSDEHPSCESIPPACLGAMLSCACVEAQTSSSGTDCNDSDGQVTVTLALP